MVVPVKLGLDSYSFHRYFGETTRWESPAQARWTLGDFLAFLDAAGVRTASLQTAYLPERETARREIGRWLAEGGREVILAWGHPAGFDGGRNPGALQDALAHLAFCREIGAARMRIVLGNQRNFRQSVPARKRLLVAPLRDLARAARRAGVLLSVENHADFKVSDLLALLDEAGEPRVGLCLDLGNALRTGDPPSAVLRDLGPQRLDIVQVRDVLELPGHTGPSGWWPAVEFGAGHVEVDECIRLLHGRGFHGPAVIELSNLRPGLSETAVARDAVRFLRRSMARQARPPSRRPANDPRAADRPGGIHPAPDEICAQVPAWRAGARSA